MTYYKSLAPIYYFVELVFELQKKNQDALIIITGKEGLGKTTMGLHAYDYFYYRKYGVVKPELVNLICLDKYEFMRKIGRIKEGNAILGDEAGEFDVRTSMTKENIMLKKTLQIIRANKLFIIMCCPSIYELDKYTAIHRSCLWIHIPQYKHYMVFDRNTKDKILHYNLKNKQKGLKAPGLSPAFRGTFPDYNGELRNVYVRKKIEKIKQHQKDLELFSLDLERRQIAFKDVPAGEDDVEVDFDKAIINQELRE